MLHNQLSAENGVYLQLWVGQVNSAISQLFSLVNPHIDGISHCNGPTNEPF